MKKIFGRFFGIRYQYYVTYICHCKVSDIPKNDKDEVEIEDEVVPSAYDSASSSISFIGRCYFNTIRKIQNKNDIDLIDVYIIEHTRTSRVCVTNFILIHKRIFMFKTGEQLKKIGSLFDGFLMSIFHNKN